MSEQLPGANAPKPWEQVDQEGLFIHEDKQGKGIAFKNPDFDLTPFLHLQGKIVTIKHS